MPAAATPSGWHYRFPKTWTIGWKIYTQVDSCVHGGRIFCGKKTYCWLCSWSRATLGLYLRFCDSFNRGRRRIVSSRRDVLDDRTTRFPYPISSLRKFFNITEFLPCKDAAYVSREVGKEQRPL
ncbi:hypothetical protein PoB_002346200 [Plakobranchus ocellatus]|uniref:Uncharacterized protein n=1 Tax=Plakobranchus ocellatus TaxID=259542 RepID=A0AAV3ZQL6_9GAST|nr:hypothetical protein PoB_002346200 [Plakobranchus ocellatus]